MVVDRSSVVACVLLVAAVVAGAHAARDGPHWFTSGIFQ